MWSPAKTRMMSAGSCSITLMLRRTASAVPRYHSATLPRSIYGWRSFTPPRLRSRSHGRPRPMWSLSERGLYWVRTTTSSMSELTQLDSVKSMIRYLPPNGTAGFARSAERIESRSPSPPARMTAIVRFTSGCASRHPWGSGGPMLARAACGADERSVSFCGYGGASRFGARDLQEQAWVDEHAVELDRPVQ